MGYIPIYIFKFISGRECSPIAFIYIRTALCILKYIVNMYRLIIAIIIIIIIIIIVVAMNMKPALPAGIANGDSVKCAGDVKIYKIVNNMKSWYPNPTIYAKYGNPPFKVITCDELNRVPNGPNMV